MASLRIPRPVPRGVNRRGAPTFDGRELKLWREAHGVSQADVADAIRMSQSYVSNIIEYDREPNAVQVKTVAEYCDAVEKIAARRARMADEGRPKLAEHRATLPTLDPTLVFSGPRLRTAEESDAILRAQGRAGEA